MGNVPIAGKVTPLEFIWAMPVPGEIRLDRVDTRCLLGREAQGPCLMGGSKIVKAARENSVGLAILHKTGTIAADAKAPVAAASIDTHEGQQQQQQQW